jgi:hypothetical protein
VPHETLGIFDALRHPVDLKRSVSCALAAIGWAVASPGDASALEPGDACDVVDVEYAVAANLRVTGTLMGAGDGEYKIGPGRVVLRFAQGPPGASPSVRMLAYEMHQRFTIESKALFLTTRVLTDTQTEVAPMGAVVVAEGALRGRSIHWTSFYGRARSDGTVVCDGAMCGKFGAPPSGKSDFHMGPTPLTFKSFEFGPDMKTFAMAPVLSSRTKDPQQESYVAFAGRETRRACVTTPP